EEYRTGAPHQEKFIPGASAACPPWEIEQEVRQQQARNRRMSHRLKGRLPCADRTGTTHAPSPHVLGNVKRPASQRFPRLPSRVDPSRVRGLDAALADTARSWRGLERRGSPDA